MKTADGRTHGGWWPLQSHDPNMPIHMRAGLLAYRVTGRFNLGICQAGIDVNGIHTTAYFDADATDHQMTLLRTDWGHEYTMKQFIKLQAKYPWPLRVQHVG